jgi:hypothetical protein
MKRERGRQRETKNARWVTQFQRVEIGADVGTVTLGIQHKTAITDSDVWHTVTTTTVMLTVHQARRVIRLLTEAVDESVLNIEKRMLSDTYTKLKEEVERQPPVTDEPEPTRKTAADVLNAYARELGIEDDDGSQYALDEHRPRDSSGPIDLDFGDDPSNEGTDDDLDAQFDDAMSKDD